MAAAKPWACATCTKNNPPDSVRCDVCETWVCARCSLHNPAASAACGTGCGAQRPAGVPAGRRPAPGARCSFCEEKPAVLVLCTCPDAAHAACGDCLGAPLLGALECRSLSCPRVQPPPPASWGLTERAVHMDAVLAAVAAGALTAAEGARFAKLQLQNAVRCSNVEAVSWPCPRVECEGFHIGDALPAGPQMGLRVECSIGKQPGSSRRGSPCAAVWCGACGVAWSDDHGGRRCATWREEAEEARKARIREEAEQRRREEEARIQGIKDAEERERARAAEEARRAAEAARILADEAARLAELRRNKERDEEYLRAFTRPCPRCRANIHRSSGCLHMNCTCGGYFNWCCGTTDRGHPAYSCPRYPGREWRQY